MDQDKRPQGREKKTTGNSQGVHKRDEALGTGKVGSKDYKEQAQGGGSFPMRAAIGGGGGAILLILAMLLFKGGGLGSLLGGGGGSGDSDSGSAPAVSGGYVASAETAVNTAVADGARAKRTVIKGNNQDTVTLMVYMCGTDLESRAAMASKDIQEMLNATVSGNINLLVYTGGCAGWKNSVVSIEPTRFTRLRMVRWHCLKTISETFQ